MFCGCTSEPFDLLKNINDLKLAYDISQLKSRIYECIGENIPILHKWLNPWQQSITKVRYGISGIKMLLKLLKGGSKCPNQKM